MSENFENAPFSPEAPSSVAMNSVFQDRVAPDPSSASVGFEVHLDLFEGPMALLYHLIEKDNLNIFDIPISQITGEYLSYIEFMQSVQVHVAGDFLVMAANLMQVKTRMLLPRVEENADAENDPRQELVSRLLIYQKFATVAKRLEEKARTMSLHSFRPPPVFEEEEYLIVQTAFDLLGSFRRVLEEYDLTHESMRAISADAYPVESKIDKIMNLLAERHTLPLDEVWKGESRREALVACFLAVLELIKRGIIRAVQKHAFGEIFLIKVLMQ